MTEINDIKQAIEDYANGKTANFSNKQFIKWLSSLITTIESHKDVLNELYNQIGQDMDINPSAKQVYLSKLKFVLGSGSQ